jgi:hypothetical protein
MVNLWAVVVAAIINIILGSLWYGPLFGKTWMGYAGYTEKDMKGAEYSSMAKSYVGMYIAAYVMAYVLAWVLSSLAIATVSGALVAAFVLWLGFVAATQIAGVLFERKPWGYFFLTTLYYLVVLFINSAILVIWK